MSIYSEYCPALRTAKVLNNSCETYSIPCYNIPIMINSLFANSYNALPMFGGVGFGILSIGFILFFILMAVVIALKGYALWNAAQRKETAWFVVLLLLNTMGILELIYLYFIVGKWKGNKTSTNSTTPPVTPNAQ